MIAEALKAYSGRRVFVTGHTGFKGAWLCSWLDHLGASITGYALPAESRSLFNQARVADQIQSLEGDIRDLDRLKAALADAKPEIVFHMAAQSLVRPSYDEPVETFAINAMGTVHLLEAVRNVPSVKAAVIVTSDKCYENDCRAEPFAETAAMGGHDPYSASKGCAELVTAAYVRSFFAHSGCAIASARAGNVIGGGGPDCPGPRASRGIRTSGNRSTAERHSSVAARPRTARWLSAARPSRRDRRAEIFGRLEFWPA